ncbi:hypothetical protein OO185_02400 [Prosthecochloris sp. SCSIO W1102]|uniref:hypothetical protein n=1 Tax=Prosthecochloris sp. SCSIO W1102 TaxID=2992243 RepID=UPI00223CD486|nr:hypothetical protein [Prosthecochloris sp. SCSIO W1102]UZJ39971.1 hypothetical protein OO185_02400 [Prosthecochloris sp. SCSIO W1102]
MTKSEYSKEERALIARRLKEEIQDKYGTQIALSKAIGAADGSYLSPYVSGRSVMGNVLQKKLRDAGLDVDYILYGSGKSDPQSLNYEQCNAKLIEMQAKLTELASDMVEMSKMMRNMRSDQDKSGGSI